MERGGGGLKVWEGFASMATSSTRTSHKRTSRQSQGCLTRKESNRALRHMTWPPQSPDLHPVEMVGMRWTKSSATVGPPGDLTKLIQRRSREAKAAIKAKESRV